MFLLKKAKAEPSRKGEAETDESKEVAVEPTTKIKKTAAVSRTKKARPMSDELEQPVKEVNAAMHPMTSILEAAPKHPEDGDLVEGRVLTLEKGALYIDLVPFGTGIIYGREFLNAREIIKKINIGDIITAKVVEAENEDGYIELSLKEARQALIWSEAEDAMRGKSVFELSVKDANKGGLILEWQGIQGFLPASQLKAEHYPRVLDGNKDEILSELQKFVGKPLAVCILSVDPKEGKLIFSEKGLEEKEKTELVERYKVGDILEGEITGIVDFGLFVKIEDGLEGLVHISEMDWGLVENPRTFAKVGEKVKVQVIEIKDGKISLSIKALKENPWVDAEKKYKTGSMVTGVVIKYNKHGALISIEEGVAGLVHISEFGDEAKLREALELGKAYPVKITLFDPKAQRMTLSYAEAQKEAKK
ncbi:MAG: S1 RNA-binding domain-containing protein [Parcubacteria group bacterium]|nr:S1 RNA-binding domain-containing protein [Parcubacteria group bacterium]